MGPINEALKQHVVRVTSALNNEGLRVIAVAVREFVARAKPYTVSDERDMTLIGYLAFLDPPKATALEAVQALQTHGVRVVVLTGDNEVVTRKVCQDVGLEVKEYVLGHEIETLGDDDLAACRAGRHHRQAEPDAEGPRDPVAPETGAHRGLPR